MSINDHETPTEAGSDGWCKICVHCEVDCDEDGNHDDDHDCSCEDD